MRRAISACPIRHFDANFSVQAAKEADNRQSKQSVKQSDG